MNKRLREDQRSFKMHEVTGFLKIISNKKQIVPQVQLHKETTDLLELSQMYAES